ncbi:adenosylcobyric acid synthase (glutamine-hydrolysing) [Sphingomonas gellani]|uniref:Cobyric acid synthase n=2 Tax=Sphingomonas gellani TaxID=1166340 RepID=A0A1H8CRC8_9SPHN|nr:adenosylcobyric acid synthase (glutamine-hydrolysing) [Sphingomonas gellani]
MFQGTGSDVGKSVLVAGLCRAFSNRGLRVRPFKPQNMSNNAAVTADGGEIGRAQATQALAARVAPEVDMNPVLLKPQGDRTSQLVVHGRVRGVLQAANWRRGREGLMPEVLASFSRSMAQADVVVVEGAGSAAEVNLRAGDIANMGFARAAGVPVVLVGDIDRGGVIASLSGTRVVLDPADAALVAGFLVNKFRGDPALFADGLTAIASHTGWRSFGVVPWLAEAARLPSEDAVVLQKAGPRGSGGRIVVACPVTRHIANFDDLDPWRLEPEVELVMVPPGTPIPAEAALVVLPGSKATIADLRFVREQGWDIDLAAHRRRGGAILGLCGGYQMLGRAVADPQGIEGTAETVAGLGLLDVETVLGGTKALVQVAGQARGAPFQGYEMHMGLTTGPDAVRPVARYDDGRVDGATSEDGLVAGSYVHGLFGLAAQRRAWLDVAGDGPDHAASVDAALDAIAARLEAHLDIDALLTLSRRADDHRGE